jgi:hypothetical protein
VAWGERVDTGNIPQKTFPSRPGDKGEAVGAFTIVTKEAGGLECGGDVGGGARTFDHVVYCCVARVSASALGTAEAMSADALNWFSTTAGVWVAEWGADAETHGDSQGAIVEEGAEMGTRECVEPGTGVFL